MDGFTDAEQQRMWEAMGNFVQKESKKINKPKPFNSALRDLIFEELGFTDAVDWEISFEKCLLSNWLNESLGKIKKFGRISQA